jgi:hypothetical protein
MSFEYDQAKIELEETKKKLIDYLRSTYVDKSDADKTFKY